MSFDLDEILEVFFEETDDHLNVLENLLSNLRPSNVQDSTINAILRAAHSIKGNSATCGLETVSKVAHEMESLLDVVRQKQGVLTPKAITLLLQGKDNLAEQIKLYKSGSEYTLAQIKDICAILAAAKKALPVYGTTITDDYTEAPAVAVAVVAPVSPQKSTHKAVDFTDNYTVAPNAHPSAKDRLDSVLHSTERTLQIIFVINTNEYPVEHVFQALAEFGEFTVIDKRVPKDQSFGQKKVLYHVNLTTMAPESEIKETLAFVVDSEDHIIIDIVAGPGEEDFGLFDIVFDPPELPSAADTSLNLPSANVKIQGAGIIPEAAHEVSPKVDPVIHDEVDSLLNELELTFEPLSNTVASSSSEWISGMEAPAQTEEDPWGMDSLAEPQEVLKNITLDPTSSAPLHTKSPVVQTPLIETPVIQVPSLPPVKTQSTPPSVPVVPSTPTLPQTSPTSPASQTKGPVLIAGHTAVLDHPLANSEYMSRTVVMPTEYKKYKAYSAGSRGTKVSAQQFQRPADRREAAADAVSLRVNLQKIEQVVDLVGEIVIAQNQLQQTTLDLDPVKHAHVLDSLQHLVEQTSALQDAVLSIRMTPMATVFNRFYRTVRELNSTLGKSVVMKTMGEDTEMDKILVEKLVDPLSHLIRNSMDHGIETSADRAAAGKSPQGYILLRAFHRANSIVIELLDDGRGMHRDRILQKAEERGMLKKDPADMSDAEVWNLVFEPGFSTAESVTSVSGRGVGMDVVKQNISELNGKIDIFSVYGKGTKITLTLPLTLSILEGMFINVSGHSFVIPMSNLTRTLTPNMNKVQSFNGFGQIIEYENQYIPLVNLADIFSLPPSEKEYEQGVWLVIESGDKKMMVWVDKLEGQQQVVLKSLEKNYKKSAGVFGATIRNDGSVSLIIEPNDVIDMTEARTDEDVYGLGDDL